VVEAAALKRCGWAGDDPDYIRYHDEEWGRPVHDDRTLFAMLVLEGFQSGLSWLTILKKRENFRKAFKNWSIQKIAKFTEADVLRLLDDAGIIRNRLKIQAAVKNAQAFLQVQKEFGSFDQYFWSFSGGKPLPLAKRVRDWKKLPAQTPLSQAMSKDLKKRGFAFVGPTVCYAYMQAVGMVDDHTADCFLAKDATQKR